MNPQSMDVVVNGKSIRVGSSEWNVKYPVKDFAALEDKIVLIYDYTSMSKGWGQIKNMKAFNFNGKELWTAKHPTNQHTDCYINFINQNPLIAYNFAGFECQINPADGTVLDTVFTK